MSATLTEMPFDLTAAVRNLITEDGEPADNVYSEKQQRLLVDALYESWTPPPLEADDETAKESAVTAPRPFWVASNVDVFRSVYLPGIAPDVFISLDVPPPADRQTCSYLMWEHGKAPEVMLEIVANQTDIALRNRLRACGQMMVMYYVVYDPFLPLHQQPGSVCVYEVGFGKRFRRRPDWQLPELGLSLTSWQGSFEGVTDEWLRWCDADGRLLLTGHERAAQAEDRAARLAAKLLAFGIDPEQV